MEAVAGSFTTSAVKGGISAKRRRAVERAVKEGGVCCWRPSVPHSHQTWHLLCCQSSLSVHALSHHRTSPGTHLAVSEGFSWPWPNHHSRTVNHLLYILRCRLAVPIADGPLLASASFSEKTYLLGKSARREGASLTTICVECFSPERKNESSSGCGATSIIG